MNKYIFQKNLVAINFPCHYLRYYVLVIGAPGNHCLNDLGLTGANTMSLNDKVFSRLTPRGPFY